MGHLDPLQWMVLLLGAAAIGLSKTGIAGLGIVGVALCAIVLGGRPSVGAVLPMLIACDIVAVCTYRRHAVWSLLARLFPSAAAGVVLGWLVVNRIDSKSMQELIGVLLILLMLLHLWFRSRSGSGAVDEASERVSNPLGSPAAAVILGMAAGFATMVANAAGPIMILYLLAAGLPKMEFVGTAAWYFMAVNLFKVPFSWQANLITPTSLLIDIPLVPVAVTAALLGRSLLPRINQRLFENVSIALTFAAAFKLLLSA